MIQHIIGISVHIYIGFKDLPFVFGRFGNLQIGQYEQFCRNGKKTF